MFSSWQVMLPWHQCFSDSEFPTEQEKLWCQFFYEKSDYFPPTHYLIIGPVSAIVRTKPWIDHIVYYLTMIAEGLIKKYSASVGI